MQRPVLRTITLGTLGNGAVEELFEHELAKVLANIDDVNTEAITPRVITIRLVLVPAPSREVALCRLEVSSKTAGFIPASTMIHFHREEKGGPLLAMQSDSRQLDLEFASDKDENQGGSPC